MSSSGEEEENIKNEPESRIAARRSRIQRRIEADKRAANGEDPDELDTKKELSKSRKQLEESRLRLAKLKKDGSELVTNIQVAGDSREAFRRAEEEESRRLRRERLEQEAKSGSERFEEITKKWESVLQKEIPQSLHEMLMQQKTACDTMLEEKNKLITDFKQELKTLDDYYVKDLKKMGEDIDLMKERIEEQVQNMRKASKEELEETERAFVAERNELLEETKKKWEEKMEKRREKEKEFSKSHLSNVEDYEQQLHDLQVHDAEEYNTVKIRLESDVQVLEQQLQQMRATYQLNQEKLEYNFQVLKKRDDENTITKSQQKRKITRFQDILNGLRIKIGKQEKQYRDDNLNLTEDCKRINKQFQDLQKKSKHFMKNDSQKFHDVWVMNENECKELTETILDADRIIHEQQLGLEWLTPQLDFLDNEGPLTEDDGRLSGLPAMEVVKEVFSEQGSQMGEVEDGNESVTEEDPKSNAFSKISAHTIKAILELLCDNAGFLVESKLNKLLAPLERNEHLLMKLDPIFKALGIDIEDDIHKLSTYFMHFKEKSDEGKSTFDEVDEEIQKVTGREEQDELPQTDVERVEFIHPNEVYKALRAFVENHRKQVKEKGGKSQFTISHLKERDDSSDSDYWQKYSTVLDEKKEHLWDALTEGLKKYHEVLKSRAGLINEADMLTQQNAELRMLLHQYVNSKVNAELEIPPTRVLQMEMNPQQN